MRNEKKEREIEEKKGYQQNRRTKKRRKNCKKINIVLGKRWKIRKKKEKMKS